MRKILITGNMGYVGPVVVQRLRAAFPDAVLVGLDMGYFATYLTATDLLPECRVDVQYFGDVRRFPRELLSGVDGLVHLAAISNDPMGSRFEEITLDVNYRGSVRVAQRAKEAGVRNFVFASSCSVYGCAEGGPRVETDCVNPLTAYARSKILAEQELSQLAGPNFVATVLRFATACGMSDRLRLDLVLNDFVASAVACGEITILSDGTPWRPLIHVQDMARAIEWGLRRTRGDGGPFLVLNTGSDVWNYRIRDLADAVQAVFPGVKVTASPNGQPDKRSYQVSFGRFRQLAPEYMPQVDLLTAVEELIRGLQAMGFADQEFRRSTLIRLNVLNRLTSQGLLTESLEWAHRPDTAAGVTPISSSDRSRTPGH